MADELKPWECYQDASYYDMWLVRRTNDRTFGQGFHLVRREEAVVLCELLNTLHQPPAPDDDLHIISMTVAAFRTAEATARAEGYAAAREDAAKVAAAHGQYMRDVFSRRVVVAIRNMGGEHGAD